MNSAPASMFERPEARTIRAMHEADLGPVRAVLTQYLSEWLGGPGLYSARRGHPRLRQRHMGFPIGNAARDAWMACMDIALGEAVDDAALREEIREALRKLADWMRNRADEDPV
jgi:hemoglobin